MEGRSLSVLVVHAAVSSAVAHRVVVLRTKALVATSSASLRVVTGLVVETSSSSCHLARVCSAVRVSTCSPLVLVETLLSLSVALAILVIGALP